MLFDTIVEPENKLVLLTSVEVKRLAEYDRFRGGKMSVKFLDEQLRVAIVSVSIKKFSWFFEELNDKTQRFIEGGFMKRFTSDASEYFTAGNKAFDDDAPALSLIMEELKIGFLVCLVPLTLAAVAFVCEIAMPFIKALAISTRDLLTFVYWIRIVAKMRMA